MKFGLAISGKNTSDVYKKNIKLISPRMFSIVAEDEEEANKTVKEANLVEEIFYPFRKKLLFADNKSFR